MFEIRTKKSGSGYALRRSSQQALRGTRELLKGRQSPFAGSARRSLPSLKAWIDEVGSDRCLWKSKVE